LPNQRSENLAVLEDIVEEQELVVCKEKEILEEKLMVI
jgi:hypothetical protein